MAIEQELLTMKRNIDRAKSDKDKAEGALEETLANLEKEFGFSAEAEIDAELKRLDEEIQKSEASLQEQVRELKESFDV